MPKEPTAADVMTRGVIAIDKDSSVMDAARKMEKDNIRSLVVVEDGEAVGILVGRDIVYEIAAKGEDASEVEVGDVMSTNLITASEDDDIEDIGRAMIKNNISRVPVLRNDNLVGMVTQSNLIQAWPSYLDLVEEEGQVYGKEEVEERREDKIFSGICDLCDNYSEELTEQNGELVCPNCREEAL